MPASRNQLNPAGRCFPVRPVPLALHRTRVLSNLQKAVAQNLNVLLPNAAKRIRIELSHQRLDLILQGLALRHQKNVDLPAIRDRLTPLYKSPALHAAQLLNRSRTQRADTVAQLSLSQPVFLPQAHEKIKHPHPNIVRRKLFLHRLIDEAACVAQRRANVEIRQWLRFLRGGLYRPSLACFR